MNDKRFGYLLADIGNTHFHLFDGVLVEHLAYEEAIEKYNEKQLYYISVKGELEKSISSIKMWENISDAMHIEGEYETMGVDRKALCLSRDEGIFVDAGSAITVDVVKEGIYQGGFILPGLKAYLASYKSISKALDTPLNDGVDLDHLPLTTKDGISYGIIASIKALITQHHTDQKLYFTGGDGLFLSHFFKDAVFEEKLVFEGMQKVLEKINKH